MGRTSLGRLVPGTILGIMAGVLLAWVSNTWLPFELPPPFGIVPATARSLLTAMIGALFTLAAFAFWMRTIAVNLVAGAVPPGVLSTYLGDRFQANLLVATASAVSFVTTILVAVPEEQNESIPLVGIVLAVLLTVAGLGALLYAMTNSVMAVDVSRIVGRISDRALAGLRQAEHRPRSDGHFPAGPCDRDVLSADTGWIAGVDVQALMDVLPNQAAAAIDVAPGDFVIAGTRIGRAWDGDDEVAATRLARCVQVTATREEANDVVFAIDQIVDIGSRAVQARARDTSLARETIGRLGLLLLACMHRHGDKAPTYEGDDGQVVMLADHLSWPDLLRRAFDPLRIDGARWPTVARQILSTLGALHQRRPTMDDDVARELRRLARLTVEECRSGQAIDVDVRDVVRHGIRLGLLSDDEPVSGEPIDEHDG